VKSLITIYGASGYTAGELLRLLNCHPQVEVSKVVSQSHPQASLAELHPQLLGSKLADLKTISPEDRTWQECDCVFFATPALIAMKEAELALQNKALVVDLSPDFRIKDLAVWRHWYKTEHSSPDLVSQAVYGLPEANRAAIKRARLIANPGCYATAIQLALLPLLADYGDRLGEELVVDAKSGVSGAGRLSEAASLAAEGDFSCYAATGHRHQAEVEEFLSDLSHKRVRLRFVPHLVPMSRGIFVDTYIPLGDIGEDNLRSCYENYYDKEPFVHLLLANQSPHTKAVRGTNHCHLALFAPPRSRYVQVCGALDNLVKGAAGLAIQNMNLALGLKETIGLAQTGLSP